MLKSISEAADIDGDGSGFDSPRDATWVAAGRQCCGKTGVAAPAIEPILSVSGRKGPVTNGSRRRHFRPLGRKFRFEG